MGQLIAVVATPILTRLYSPAEFGVLAAGSSIVSLVVVLASLRYETALPLPKDDEGAVSLLVLCAGLVLLATISTGVVFVVAGPQISDALQSPQLTPLLWLLLLSLFVAGLNQVLAQWAVRVHAFKQLATTRVSQSITMSVSQVALGAIGGGAAALLFGDALGRAGGSWSLTSALLRREARHLRNVTLRSVRHAAARYWRFPMFSGPSAVINAALLQAPVVFLLALYGPHMGGLYLLVHRVASLPIRVIGTSVAQVYFGESSRRVTQDPAALQIFFRRTLRHLALAGVIPSILLVLLAPTVFPIIFGSEWAEGGVFLAIMAPMYFLLFLMHPVSATLDVLERQDLVLIAELVGLILTFGAMGFAAFQGLTALHAIQALAFAGSGNSLVHLALTWFAVRRHAAGRSSQPLGS